MALDITTLTSQGLTKFEPQTIVFATNNRNPFEYHIKFEYFVYSDVTKNLTCRFDVKRYFNNEIDIEYKFDSIAADATVDKYGNVTDVPEEIWGTEFERMQVLMNAPIADSYIIELYTTELFDKGLLDKPKR